MTPSAKRPPSLATVLPTLMRELVDGSPDPSAGTFMLNRGDPGLLASLERISAYAASTTHGGGASIAAHVDHIRFGLALLNRWASGEPSPWKGADWTASWKRQAVTDEEWRELLEELRREARMWTDALRMPRELNDAEAGWVAGSVAHLAYHFGAIRQIDRSTRGPTAEEEAKSKAAAR
jgi:hypothetical protein